MWMAASAVTLLVTPLAILTAPTNAQVVAKQPQRILDTRSGLGAPAHRVDRGEVVTLPVTAARNAGALSVALNLTATDALAPGYLTAWPCGQPMPATSVVNYVPGRTTANFLAIGIGHGGVCLAASTPVHVVADLESWFLGTPDFRGAAPTRLVDTRVNHTRLAANSTRRIPVTNGAGYTSDAGAIAVNVTVVNPSAAGFVVVYPCGQRPLASTVNFTAGEIVPNYTIVKITSGAICAFSSAATDLVVDSFGWSTNTGGLRASTPFRMLDTRSGVGGSSVPPGSSAAITLRVAGRGPVDNGSSAALLTITATGGSANGFVTAWPCDQPRPLASVLNLRPGLIGSNLALLPLSVKDGTVCLYTWTVDGSPLNLVVDAVGFVPAGIKRSPAPPEGAPTGGAYHFGTLPPGSPLPSDAYCAAHVRSAPEIRSGNAVYNATRGHPTKNPPDPIYARVDGNFTGTTDEIIQWVACKWGIDEDIVRAQTAGESWWHQDHVGDSTTDPKLCAPGHPIGADGTCPESVGLMSLRYQFWSNAFPDAETSSAYNLDYALAARRQCFEGQDTILNQLPRGATYAAGDIWGCVGLWFSGRWYAGGAQNYIAMIKDLLARRIWATHDFIVYG
jgi:hypothetical protein